MLLYSVTLLNTVLRFSCTVLRYSKTVKRFSCTVLRNSNTVKRFYKPWLRFKINRFKRVNDNKKSEQHVFLFLRYGKKAILFGLICSFTLQGRICNFLW